MRAAQSSLHPLRLLPIVAVGLCPLAAGASSYLNASVGSSIWGVPEYSCGSTTTGNTAGPVPGVAQSCTHDYTTVGHTASSIQLHSAAESTWDQIRLRSAGHWSGLAAPDFTGGGWGVTAYVDSLAFGASHIEGWVINTGDQPFRFSMSATMFVRGTMFFDTATSYAQVIQFPWGGQVRGDLLITLGGLGGGCTLFANANQADLATFVAPNGFGYDLSCVGGAEAMVPAHGVIVLGMDLSGSSDAASNPAIVTTTGGGDYGVDLDFFHTMGATNFRFAIDDIPVAPGSIPFQSDARIVFTSTGIVPVPEPATAPLLAEGVLVLLGAWRVGSRRRTA